MARTPGLRSYAGLALLSLWLAAARFAPASQASVPALIVDISGKVQIIGADGKSREAVIGEEVSPGEQLRSAEAAAVLGLRTGLPTWFRSRLARNFNSEPILASRSIA